MLAAETTGGEWMTHGDFGERAGLKRFSDLSGFAVADDDPDVRGWDVVAADGQVIGEVDDLFVDTEHMKVRELDVDIKGGEHVTVPVERVEVDHRSRQVRIPGYTEGAYGRQSSEYDTRGAGDRFATDEARLTRSEEELRIGKQQVQAGEVVVGKHVETERVSEPVSLNREEIVMERRPVAPGRSSDSTAIGEDEIRIPLVEEEAVVEKRPVVKEELVVGKHTVEDTKTVETELRREEFDVDDATNRASTRKRE